MLPGQIVILSLKIAVIAVSVLLAASVIALARGNVRLHGRINIAFFALTVTALVVFEGIIRLYDPTIFDFLNEEAYTNVRQALAIHLWFAVPSAMLMPVMLVTGLRGYRVPHLVLAVVFGFLWLGTFVSGVFFL